jgi:hypothetical protein
MCGIVRANDAAFQAGIHYFERLPHAEARSYHSREDDSQAEMSLAIMD